MAEQDSDKPGSDKQGQVSNMDPRQTTEVIPRPTEPTGAILGADLQAHIGRQLRAVYDEVVGEAVPDRFLKLLEELERKQAPRS